MENVRNSQPLELMDGEVSLICSDEQLHIWNIYQFLKNQIDLVHSYIWFCAFHVLNALNK